MIAFDTNVLVYAHRREARVHQQALALLRKFAEGTEPWAIPWPCLHEFFSVTTNVRIWKDRASTPEQAWEQIEAWCAAPTVRVLAETTDFLPLLKSTARHPRVRGAVIHDARVAALCIAHGVESLYTADRDFSLFPMLNTLNPFS